MKWLPWLDAVLGGLLFFNAAVVAHFLYKHAAEPWMYLMLGNTFLLGWFCNQQLNEYLQRKKHQHAVEMLAQMLADEEKQRSGTKR
jgi:hypothetical protein